MVTSVLDSTPAVSSTREGGMTDDNLDEKRRQLRDEYIAAKGFWPEMHNALLELDPDFLRAFMEFSSATRAKGALDQKTRHLIFVAVNASATHLYNPGTKNHIREALNHGATVDQIVEVLEMVTGVGMHSTAEGMPLLLEVLQELDGGAPDVASTD
jgi:alkylhydroperoxidase/carboxymuconolactone decarboxylase family protein YurZ